MTTALKTLSTVIRRKHLALNTEQIFCGWLKRYCNYLQTLPPHLPSELKLERFLTALAQNHVTASTRNQACNAILFFYVLTQDKGYWGGEVDVKGQA